MDRKQFLQMGGIAVASAAVPGLITACNSKANTGSELFFDISLAQWSLHKALFDGELTNLECYGKKRVWNNSRRVCQSVF